MPLRTSQATIGSAASALFTANVDGSDPVSLVIIGDGSWYVGGADVTTSGATKGILVASGERFTFDVSPGDKVYGVRAGATDVNATILRNRG